MSNELQEWHPPQEKLVRKLVGGASIFALVVGGAVVIKHTVPTISDALLLLQQLLANGISTALTAAGLGATLYILWETFSKHGKIRKIWDVAFSSFCHQLTFAIIENDPMSPLKDSLSETKELKAYYDEQFAQFDGSIANFRSNESNLRDAAAKSEKRAKAAHDSGDDKAFQRLSYEVGSNNEAANDLKAMADRLEPIRQLILRLQEEAGDLIYKLEIDIRNTEVTWKAANSMTKMEGAARKIISSQGKSELAKEAQRIVQTKYATAIGRLRNLNDLARPLLENADLDKATYSQELLAKWEASASSSPAPLQITQQASVLAPAMATDFSKLIDQ